jgi:DNA-binding NtrC family response regulator
MARLLFCTDDPSTGAPPLFVHRLRESRVRIGRSDDCDVVLPDDAVSRTHCILSPAEGGWEVLDRSSNGTFLRGERVSRAALADRDVIRVGPFHVQLDAEPGVRAESTESAQAEARDEEVVDAKGEVRVRRAELLVTEGPAKGAKFALKGARTTIGGAGSGVVLRDPGLAPDHVRVRLYHGRTMLEPGRGAAFIGNLRVRDTVPLGPDEPVTLGSTTLRIQWKAVEERPEASQLGELVGTSPAMRAAFGMLRRMAAHDAPVLLLGESGTGKELAARAVHDASPRAAAKFVAVNCGAITPTLFESELFGHEKGAFTGADQKRDGAFQRADGGTLFLDEVGELPEEAQVKLLRALETGEVRRVGGAEPTFPDVRIVAATNRDLAAGVRDQAFRQDLYYRLAVLAVRLPPLRDRPEDIPVLASEIARRIDPEIRVTGDALKMLRAHNWPGNARELRNVLTRAFVLHGPIIAPGALEFTLDPPPLERPAPDHDVLRDGERAAILEALRRTSNNRAEAARLLGIPRSSLLYKLKRLGIDG